MPNLAIPLKKTPFNEITDFIFENCYKPIRFSKKYSYYLMKHL